MKNDVEKLADNSTQSDGDNATKMRAPLSDLSHLDASCRQISREFEHLGVRQQAQQKALKSRFNVFTAVLKYDDEVKLHSRWLHYLLNPAAEHDCDTMFLNLFIQTLQQLGAQQHGDEKFVPMDDLSTFASDSIEVKKEHHTSYGNIDIHIENKKWLIVVENKTKSGERENQISDYVKYCVEHCRHSNKKPLIIFLTPDGRQADSAGECKNEYRRISYLKHILPWLEECLRETYSFAHINQALQQYKNVVNQLLKRSSDHVYMNEVTKILKKHPSVIAHLAEINDAVEQVKSNYWEVFVLELEDQLKKHDITLGTPDKCNAAPTFYLEPPIRSWKNSFPELKTTLQYFDDCICIGESVWPPNAEKTKEFQVKKDTFVPVINRFVCEFPGEYHAQGNGVWPLGWTTFLKGFMLPAFLAENAAEHSRPMREQVTNSNLVEDIVRYRKTLEDACASIPGLQPVQFLR